MGVELIRNMETVSRNMYKVKSIHVDWIGYGYEGYSEKG